MPQAPDEVIYASYLVHLIHWTCKFNNGTILKPVKLRYSMLIAGTRWNRWPVTSHQFAARSRRWTTNCSLAKMLHLVLASQHFSRRVSSVYLSLAMLCNFNDGSRNGMCCTTLAYHRVRNKSVDQMECRTGLVKKSQKRLLTSMRRRRYIYLGIQLLF